MATGILREEDSGAGPDRLRPQSLRIEDAAALPGIQPWVEIEYVQLSAGREVARVDGLDLGGLKIVRETQAASVQKLGATPADFCTLSVSTEDPWTRFSEHSCERADTVFFLPGGAEFDVHVPAGSETAYVGFSQEEFLRGARVLNPDFWDSVPQGAVPVAGKRRRAFQDTIDLLLANAFSVPENDGLEPAALRHHVLHAFLQLAVPSHDDAPPDLRDRIRALQIGRTARAFVEERLSIDEFPTVVDICTAVGVSERTLQYAFREYVGMAPLAYLRACRLNRVRRVLAEANPAETTVTRVAMHFGFLHLGRFGGDYRKMFGETPSQALAS